MIDSRISAMLFRLGIVIADERIKDDLGSEARMNLDGRPTGGSQGHE